jgi:hypothetical protein
MEGGGRAGEREEYRLIWNIIIYNNMGDGGARLARATGAAAVRIPMYAYSI